MRVALVSQEYPPETAKGGIGTQTHAKAHGLAALGHEVHVISRSPMGSRCEYRDGDVCVTRIGDFHLQMPVNNWTVDCLTYSALVAAEISALHARQPLDIVEFPEWGGEGYIHLLNRQELGRIPTVIQLHGPLVMYAHVAGWPELDSELYRVVTAMEGTSVRLADGVYSSSAYSAQWCAKSYSLSADQIPVIHTGVDIRQFAPLGGQPEQMPTVIFVGRISKNKGADVLFEACCLLAHELPNLRLRLLGRDKDQLVDGFRRRARELGFPDLVDCPGFVPREELPQQLNRAHVFAAPSRYEAGPGLVNLEAMACGLPIVVTSGSGAAEVVQDGQSGMLVPPGDVRTLASALARLLSNSSLRDEMGKAARRYVMENADSDACLKRIEAFLLAHSQKTRS